MRLTWLADVLRGAGCTVVAHDGWQARGKELLEVRGVVWHHTASGPNWTDDRVAALLIAGRPDLPGPLCQLGLDRAGRYHLIAAGKGNHNGYGEWGNQAIGIEAFNDGKGEPWPTAQVDAYVAGTAALCRRAGLTAARVKGHRETDPARKIDPAGLDMAEMRRRVADLLITPAQPTPPTQGPLMALTDAEQTELLTKVRENHLRLVELQAEVVADRDAKGNSRMDRIAALVARIKG